ncbi:MAG TPA: lytic transglycosylase domain-containing protein [Longimicrobiales bacterium]|nr:lytic transglycosylase domain-containing protein [Longimicrobiales bacterium]
MTRLPGGATRLALALGGLGLLGASAVLRTPAGHVEPSARATSAVQADAGTVTFGALPATGAGLGPDWDLPNLDHPRIDYWVDRFQNVPEMREKFEGFLERGAEWAPMILERLESRGMPLDLLYLAMIESGFNPVATSHASAVGIWQFMAPTGRQYGLAMDRAVDERRDPIRATDAALDYLEQLHRRFGSWYLASAAYNTGQGRLSRIMRQQFGRERARGEEDYYRILDRLPAETRDYVPLMIAAARITKDPAAYGFAPMQLRPREWDELTVPPATPLDRLAERVGASLAEIRELNPHLLLDRTPNNRAYPVRLPAGSLVHLAGTGIASDETLAE